MKQQEKTIPEAIKKARKEALKILKKDNAGYSLRSCWKCNSAHEHLKKATYPICCFGCGHWYYKGLDITQND